MPETATQSARAVARYIRISPTKVRQVINLVRGKPVRDALTLLQFVPKRASVPVSKVIRSAAANAEHNLNLNRDRLYIAEAYVDDGPTLKRYHPRMRGQAFPILKRSCHITVVVREREEQARGTKGTSKRA